MVQVSSLYLRRVSELRISKKLICQVGHVTLSDEAEKKPLTLERALGLVSRFALVV